jgi:hypothetical protein
VLKQPFYTLINKLASYFIEKMELIRRDFIYTYHKCSYHILISTHIFPLPPFMENEPSVLQPKFTFLFEQQGPPTLLSRHRPYSVFLFLHRQNSLLLNHSNLNSIWHSLSLFRNTIFSNKSTMRSDYPFKKIS